MKTIRSGRYKNKNTGKIIEGYILDVSPSFLCTSTDLYDLKAFKYLEPINSRKYTVSR